MTMLTHLPTLVEKEMCQGAVDSTGVARFWLEHTNILPDTLHCRLFLEELNDDPCSAAPWREILSFHEYHNINRSCGHDWKITSYSSDKIGIGIKISLTHCAGLVMVSPMPISGGIKILARYYYQDIIQDCKYAGKVIRSLDAPWMEG